MNQLRSISRRQLLRIGSSSLLAAGLWPGCLRAEEDGHKSSFTFIEINDLHYVEKACGDWLLKVLTQIKGAGADKQPEFLLLVGDLTDNGKPEQLTAVREIFSGAKIPYYVQIGNHDYLKQDDRKAYESTYAGRINYNFDHRGWQFVSIDSTNGQKASGVQIVDASTKFLDDTLPKLDKKKPTVLFTHFPLGEAVTYRPKNAEAVLDRFKEHNLQAVFNGHWHGKSEKKWHDATITTSVCCALKRGNHDGSKEKGYFLCRAKEGKISREFVEVKQA